MKKSKSALKIRKRPIHNFTLIELLVVVAIISFLAALLMPSLKSAKDSAKRAKCQSNLHQIGLAIQMYVNDKEGYLHYAMSMGYENPPPPGLPTVTAFLQDAIRGQLGGVTPGFGTNSPVFVCPSVKMSWVLTTDPRNDYRYNYWFANGWSMSWPGRKADSLLMSTRAVLVWDMSWENWPATDMPHDGVNVLYADGHVAYVKAATYITEGFLGETSVSPLSPFYNAGF